MGRNNTQNKIQAQNTQNRNQNINNKITNIQRINFKSVTINHNITKRRKKRKTYSNQTNR